VSSTAPARRYRGQSLDERRAERRALLIEAAIGVYGEVGYRNASVKAVCEAAGLTERYFYESFAGSDDLLAAAYEVVVADLHAAMREATAGADDPVRAALTEYYTRLRESPNAARVFLVEIGGVSPKVDAVVRQALADSGPMLAPHVAANAAAPELVTAGCVGAVIQIALDWIASGYARPLEDVVEAARSVCAAARG
jgi:AcrR family transcriptional regulator